MTKRIDRLEARLKASDERLTNAFFDSDERSAKLADIEEFFAKVFPR